SARAWRPAGSRRNRPGATPADSASEGRPCRRVSRRGRAGPRLLLGRGSASRRSSDAPRRRRGTHGRARAPRSRPASPAGYGFEAWAAARSRGTQTPLDVLDPGVEHGDVLSESRQGALEDLTPRALVGQQGLDTPKRLGNGLVLLLQPLETPIDLVEVPEDLAAQLVEALVDGLEALVDRVEAAIDRLEALTEEGDELLVFGPGHASTSTLPGPKLQVCRIVDACWTGGLKDRWPVVDK